MMPLSIELSTAQHDQLMAMASRLNVPADVLAVALLRDALNRHEMGGADAPRMDHTRPPRADDPLP